MTTAFLDDVANAPDPEPDLFGDAEFDGEQEAPQRTSETRAKGTRVRVRECEECGKTFTGGRKVCPDCKGTAAPRQASTGTRGNAKLAEDLLETLVSTASDISAVAPTVAGVLIARAEVAVDGMMALAKGHKRTTAVLQRVASASKIAELLSFGALLIVAGMVDLGKMPLDSPILDRVGYAEIVRDEKGKARKDDQGKIVKDRKTIRDIHDLMTGQDTSEHAPDDSIPVWNNGYPTMQPDTGTAPYTMPPMNWTP
jgi:hypothetical protein